MGQLRTIYGFDSLTHLGAPHQLVAYGREEILRVHANQADGERGPFETHFGVTSQRGTTRIHTNGKGHLALDNQTQMGRIGHNYRS